MYLLLFDGTEIKIVIPGSYHEQWVRRPNKVRAVDALVMRMIADDDYDNHDDDDDDDDDGNPERTAFAVDDDDDDDEDDDRRRRHQHVSTSYSQRNSQLSSVGLPEDSDGQCLFTKSSLLHPSSSSLCAICSQQVGCHGSSRLLTGFCTIMRQLHKQLCHRQKKNLARNE